MSQLRRISAETPLREIEVLIISAEGLKNVKHVTKMRTYAVAYVEKHRHAARTRVDEDGGTNPTWNEVVTVKFRRDLPDNDVMAALNVDIFADGRLKQKPVGSARVLLCDVLKGGDPANPVENPVQVMTVRVWRPSGRSHGLLNLWIPPTGRFLLTRDSLSFSVPEEETEAVADGGGEAVKMNGDG